MNLPKCNQCAVEMLESGSEIKFITYPNDKTEEAKVTYYSCPECLIRCSMTELLAATDLTMANNKSTQDPAHKH